MTPKQREELKAAAQKATPGPWSWWTSNSTLRLTGADGKDGGVLHGTAHRGYGDVACSAENAAFIERANPSAILSLIAQVEAMNRKNLELQRVYDERGLQIGRLEVALQRANEAKIGTQPAHEEIIRTGGMLMCTACGTISKEPAWEKLPEVYFDEDAAPTIPAIPGTKEATRLYFAIPTPFLKTEK